MNGPRQMLPYSSMFIFGQTNPYVQTAGGERRLLIIAQQVVEPTQKRFKLGSVLLDCAALCVLESSTSVDCVIDCRPPWHNPGITRGAPNIPQSPFMSAMSYSTSKWLKIKLELAAELASEPEWVDGKIPARGQIAEPSEQIIFTFWSLLCCYVLKLLLRPASKRERLWLRVGAMAHSSTLFSLYLPPAISRWMLWWDNLTWPNLVICHPSEPILFVFHVRPCVLPGCDGCVTTWSTYATSKCASWSSLPWAASLWQPRTPCKPTRHATTWVTLTSWINFL